MGFVLRFWIGQTAEHSRDDFKDASMLKFRKKFRVEAFFEYLTFTNIEEIADQHILIFDTKFSQHFLLFTASKF